MQSNFSISLSNGGDYITSDQLQRKILEIDRGESCSKSTETRDIDDGNKINGELMNNYEEDNSESEDETDWSQKSDDSNEKLTEDHLVSAAIDYSHGQLPIVNNILCLTDPNLKALDHIPFIYWSILNPWLAIKILYFKLLKYLGRKTMPLIYPLLKSDFHIILLLFIYALISSNNVLYFFPMLVYYISFTVMIFTTFQMLQRNREFFDFRLWSGLFICYSGGTLNGENAEIQYIKNNLKPYGQFFISLIINLLVYPLISHQWFPHSELTIVAFCLTFMTLFGFMAKRRSKTIYDSFVLLSFAVNVLAKYPYETDPVVAQGWRFLDLNIPTFPSYVIGNGIEFCINFNMLLYLCIPLLFVRIASKDNWRGTYKTLIPHCVTLSWLQICIISSQGATMFGFLRGVLALVGVVLFLPLVGITSVILPVIAVTKWIIMSNLIYSFCLFLILSVLGLGVCYVCAQTRFRKYTAIIQVFLMMLAFFVLINSHVNNVNNNNDEQYYDNSNKIDQYMSWEVFQKFCHQPVWQEENVAVAQIKCAELENTLIHWDGYVTDIKIKSISNTWKKFIDKLPSTFASYLYCFYGEEVKDDCKNIPDIVRDDCLSFYNSIKFVNKCSLEKYNVYNFEILITMQSGIWAKTTQVSLDVADVFKNFTLGLKPNDHIWFKGSIYNNEYIGADGVLGGFKPCVKLNEIGCISCFNKILTDTKISIDNNCNLRSVLNMFYSGCKFILNVLFNPIVIIK